MADIFQIDYEQMEQITAMFKTAAEATEELRGHIQGSFEPLESGDWRGEGFSAFASTMNGALFPAFDRLLEVFGQAASLTDEVAKLIRAAEEEAADVFEGESEGFLDSVGDFFSGAGEAFGNFWSGAGEWVHGGLDVLGFIPGFGEVADGINGLIYLAEGRHLEAGISFAAMIPIVGDAGKVGKYGVKITNAVAGEVIEEGVERVVKEVTEEVVEEGAEKVVKHVTEETLEETAQRVPGIVQNLPKNPDDLLTQGWKETSHPGAAANGHRTFVDEKTGLTIRFDKGKPGAGGFKEVDHYHIENPHATTKKGQYFDQNGNPVNDGSGPSHIIVK